MAKLNAVLARNVNKVAPSVCGFSHTVAFSHYNNLSAQLPVDAKGKLVSKDVKEQATQCLKNIESIVKDIKHSMDDVVRLTIFTKSVKDIEIAIKALDGFYKKSYKPALTTMVVKNLPLKASVQIEAVITCGEGTIPNAPQSGDLIKLARNTKNAPDSKVSTQTVAFSHYNHLSAQLPIDPKSGKLIKGDVQEQLAQALKNVRNILESIDVVMDDIVKVNIYTTSLKYEKDIREVYKTFFPDSGIARAINYLPALSINEVVELPLGAKVQAEVVVSHGDGTPPQLVEDRHGIVVEFNNTNKAPIDPLSSQTVMFSHYNNISQIFPADKDNKLVGSDVKSQFEQCLKNLKTIVESVKHSMDDVVKLNIFVKDIKSMDDLETIMKKYFKKSMPAGRVIEVSNIATKVLVKIDAIVSNAEGTPPCTKCKNFCGCSK